MGLIKKILSYCQTEEGRELNKSMALLKQIDLLEMKLRNKERRTLVDRLKKELEENG